MSLMCRIQSKSSKRWLLQDMKTPKTLWNFWFTFVSSIQIYTFNTLTYSSWTINPRTKTWHYSYWIFQTCLSHFFQATQIVRILDDIWQFSLIKIRGKKKASPPLGWREVLRRPSALTHGIASPKCSPCSGALEPMECQGVSKSDRKLPRAPAVAGEEWFAQEITQLPGGGHSGCWFWFLWVKLFFVSEFFFFFFFFF